MTIALARYLKDFSEPQPAAPAFPIDSDGIDPSDGEAAAGEPEPVDVDAVRNEAFAEGREAAANELRLRHDAEIEALQAVHAGAIEALRQRYEAEAAALIAEKMQQIAKAIALSVSEQAAEVLAPVVAGMIAEKAVGQLADMIAKAVRDGTAGVVVVRGPESLFDILKARLGDDASLLRHVDETDLDLSVEIGGTVLVTRLSAWAASLKKVLE